MTIPFETIGNNPDVWIETAEALVYNAEVLKRHRDESEAPSATADVDRTFAELLLWGYALEAFYKALFLKQGGALVVGDALDPKVGMGNHDLVKMALKVHYPLDGKQQDALQRLSAILLWGGRYPIAKTSSTTFVPCYWSQPEDDSTVEQIIESIRKIA